MSDSTKNATVDDLLAKTRKPNHLASQVELRAADGAAVPKHLLPKYHHLKQLTQLTRQALSELLPKEILDDCYVVFDSTDSLTLAVSSPTAANHARYMMVNCVQALRAYDAHFCQLQSIKVILAPKMTQSDARQDLPKKVLSENTRINITQSAQFVTKNDSLRTALLKLAQDVE